MKRIITEMTNDIIDIEKKYMSYTTRVPYFPLVVDEAKGLTVTDIEGNEFIDFLSSAAVINTGHNHPRIVEAIKKQVDKCIHYTPAYMYHEPHTKLAQKIVEITPGNYEKRVAFGISGSSSVDGAIKAAKAYTKRSRIVSFLRSYHGTTVGAISVSGISLGMRKDIGPLMSDVYFIPYPDSYRGNIGMSIDDVGSNCINYFKELLETVLPADEIAAVIYEPIQGDAGVLIPPNGFYKELESICRKSGILLIADEVQTGFGRTGKMFATEYFDIEPDILVFGKAIASGMPLSGIVARKEIFESWGAPAHFFNTAGNPISCVAAIETIQIIKDEKLMDNANKIGEYIMSRFTSMMDEYECVGDVRGKGLLIGVDIVKNRSTKERDIKMTAKICWRCWEKGLILAFFSGSVLRIAPPLTISIDEAKKAIDIIEESIKEAEAGLVSDEVLEVIKGW